MALETFRPIPFRYRGTFDLQGIYDATFRWMRGQQMLVFQRLYKDKIGASGTWEKEIRTVGFLKVDEYVKWEVEVFFRVWDGKDIVVTENNVQKKMMQGRLSILITATFETNYSGVFGKDSMQRKFRALVDKLRGKDEELYPLEPFHDRLLLLQDEFKRILGVQTTQ